MNTYKYTSDNYDPHTLKEYLDTNMAEPCYPSTAGSTITIGTDAGEATLNTAMFAYLAQDNKLEKMRLDCIATCHAEAERRIQLLIPQSSTDPIASEMNLLMEVSLLLRKEALGTATAEDVAMLDYAVTLRDAIKAIRDAEVVIQADIALALDPCDVLIEHHISWPA